MSKEEERIMHNYWQLSRGRGGGNKWSCQALATNAHWATRGRGRRYRTRMGVMKMGTWCQFAGLALPCFAKGFCTKTYSLAIIPTLNTFIIQSRYSMYLSYNSLLALSIIQDCLVLDPLGCGRGRVGSGVMGSLPPRHLAGCSPSPLLYQQLSITPSLTTLTTWKAGTLLCIFNLQTWSLFTSRQILANDCLIVLLDTFSQRTQLNENLDIPVTSNSKLIVNMSSENMHTEQVKGGNNGNNSKIISKSSMVNCSTCTRTASEAKGTLAISMQFQCPPQSLDI